MLYMKRKIKQFSNDGKTIHIKLMIQVAKNISGENKKKTKTTFNSAWYT